MGNIGARIRAKRIELGLSQEELATLMNYKNRSSIARIEAGTADLTRSKIIEFANVLETSVEYLVGKNDVLDEYVHVLTRQIGASEKKLETILLQHYRQLNKRGKKEAAKRVEEMTFVPAYTEDETYGGKD